MVNEVATNLHKKSELPPKPGKYWVLLIKDKSYVCDDGYAIWDGHGWDRNDWDLWYWTESVSAFAGCETN